MDLRLPTINKVMISGYLTDDPRANVLENGTHVASFGIASNQRYLGRDKEWHDKTCFVTVVAWRQTAERVAAKLHKGSPVMVEGELQLTKWVAQDGSNRSRIEILARKVQMLEKTGGSYPSNSDRATGTNAQEEPPAPEFEDDVPF